jgi:uncharacterized protein (TIGR00369 family)
MSDGPGFDRSRVLARLNEVLGHAIPHGAALGLHGIDCGPGWAILELPWNAGLVGDPDTGVLFGGAVTTLIDQTCGMSVFMTLPTPTRIATLDLRIDYLRPAAPGRALRARAECYRLARHVAFVRADAYHQEDGAERTLVAASLATFMIFGEGRSPIAEALRR